MIESGWKHQGCLLPPLPRYCRRLEAAKTYFVQGQIGTWWSSHVEADRQLGGVVGGVGGGASDDTTTRENEELVATEKEGICYVIFWTTRRKLPA